MVGECFKSTDLTPSITSRLNKGLRSQYSNELRDLAELRNTLSHLTAIPDCTQDTINHVEECTTKKKNNFRAIMTIFIINMPKASGDGKQLHSKWLECIMLSNL